MSRRRIRPAAPPRQLSPLAAALKSIADDFEAFITHSVIPRCRIVPEPDGWPVLGEPEQVCALHSFRAWREENPDRFAPLD